MLIRSCLVCEISILLENKVVIIKNKRELNRITILIL